MKIESISYDVAGSTYVGYLADGGGRNGVLIAGEGTGLGPQVKDRAHALAELGYVAFCADFIGGGRVLDMAEMMPKLTALRADTEGTRALARAALAQLAPRVDRVAAIGYCFGGTFVFELARDGAELAAVVGFHAGLATHKPGPIKGKVLACIGADDPLVPPAERAAFEIEMKAAGCDWRLYTYGGAVHGFANPLANALNNPAVRYHEPTHRRSWAEMFALFGEVF